MLRALRVLPAILLLAAPWAWTEIPAMTPPLHWAARNGQVEIARMLIAGGADVDAVDALGRTPLHVGVEHPAIVELLLAGGASVDALDEFDNTPLHRAVRWERSVALLIEYGADVSARNAFRKSPLDLCMRSGASAWNLSIMRMLIEAGAH